MRYKYAQTNNNRWMPWDSPEFIMHRTCHDSIGSAASQYSAIGPNHRSIGLFSIRLVSDSCLYITRYERAPPYSRRLSSSRGSVSSPYIWHTHHRTEVSWKWISEPVLLIFISGGSTASYLRTESWTIQNKSVEPWTHALSLLELISWHNPV